MSHLRAISLFSGVGGMDIAASVAGWDIVAQVEIDKYCRRKLYEHSAEYWPNAAQFVDVREFGRHSISGYIDLIYGGFPCQDISTAGNRNGIVRGARSGLWSEFRRIVGEIRPRYVLVENVRGIISPTQETAGPVRPADAFVVAGELASMGYVCRTGIVSAADAGAAHVRERWWLVAHARRDGHNAAPAGKRTCYPQRDSSSSQSPGRSVIHEVESGGEVLGNASSTRPQKCNASTVTGEKGHASGKRPLLGNPTGEGWIPQPGMGRAADGIPAWMVRPKPALQGETQHSWEPPRIVSKNRKGANHATSIGAIGNSVYVPLAYALFVALREAAGATDHEAAV